jgi:hypothetical protein
MAYYVGLGSGIYRTPVGGASPGGTTRDLFFALDNDIMDK